MLLAAAAGAVVVLNILSSHPSYFLFVYFLLFGAGQLWIAKRPPTVVSPSGIRRPWRRATFLSWEAVDFVDAPVPGVYGTKVTLKTGKVIVLDDVPATRSAAVAALGHKPLKAAARSPMPAPPVRERTPMDIYADVTRQAEALARQRTELAERSRSIRGYRQDPPKST